jgi:hypothetical protein
MDDKKINEVKNILRNVNSITPWNTIKSGDILHIPPIISLERRDIVILEKYDNELSYKRIDVSSVNEEKLHKSSIFAKIMIRKKSF